MVTVTDAVPDRVEVTEKVGVLELLEVVVAVLDGVAVSVLL